MPNYLARVVLHRLNSKGNDSSEDYKDFHAFMEKIGFEQIIEGQTDKTYHLPGGMYYFDSTRPINKGRTYTLDSAYQAVNAAVEEVVKDESQYIKDANNPHTVFVAETPRSRWIGLKPVKQGIRTIKRG